MPPRPRCGRPSRRSPSWFRRAAWLLWVALLLTEGSAVAAEAGAPAGPMRLTVVAPASLNRALSERLRLELPQLKMVGTPAAASVVAYVTPAEGALRLTLSSTAGPVLLRRRFSLAHGQLPALRAMVLAVEGALQKVGYRGLRRRPLSPPAPAGPPSVDASGSASLPAAEPQPPSGPGAAAPEARAPSASRPLVTEASPSTPANDSPARASPPPPREASLPAPTRWGPGPTSPGLGSTSPRRPSPMEVSVGFGIGVGAGLSWVGGAPQLGVEGIVHARPGGRLQLGLRGSMAGLGCCDASSRSGGGAVALQGPIEVWTMGLEAELTLLRRAVDVTVIGTGGVEHLEIRVVPVVFDGDAPTTRVVQWAGFASMGLGVRGGFGGGAWSWRLAGSLQLRTTAPEVALPPGFPRSAQPLEIGSLSPGLTLRVERSLF